MTRRYADPVEVQRAVRDGQVVPASFMWRGRLYVVRGVLGHWWERRSWWATAGGRAIHGDGEAPDQPADPAQQASGLGSDREVWRVEASRGQAFGTGVYDLCAVQPHPQPQSQSSAGDGWRLIRVAD